MYRQFQPLEATFSRLVDLQCPVHYTGYVVQPQPDTKAAIDIPQPLILVSVGGGRFGHDLLHCVADAAPLLASQIPHQIQMFTGPFAPAALLTDLQTKAQRSPNLQVDRFTPNLLHYMNKADLSISMSGYNTTMNILTTGVKAMLLPFTGNDDQEQTIRSQKLEQLGVIKMIQPEDLSPERFTEKVIQCLQKSFAQITFDFDGVNNTTQYLKQLVLQQQVA
jgi:predicted glycosyltransferase